MRTIKDLERDILKRSFKEQERLLTIIERSVSHAYDGIAQAMLAEDLARMERIAAKYRPDTDDPNWLSEQITRQILAEFRPCECPPPQSHA